VRANAAGALYRLGRKPAALQRLADDSYAPARTNAERALTGPPAPARNDWITLYLVDFDGTPLPDMRYRLTLPDGLVKVGAGDGRGIAHEESVPAGSCTLALDE
jgi:hypothetical protein